MPLFKSSMSIAALPVNSTSFTLRPIMSMMLAFALTLDSTKTTDVAGFGYTLNAFVNSFTFSVSSSTSEASLMSTVYSPAADITK